MKSQNDQIMKAKILRIVYGNFMNINVNKKDLTTQIFEQREICQPFSNTTENNS